MRLDAVLRAHGFMKVERPPKLWEADTEDVRFLPLLGEMIAAPLSRGAELHDLTLSVSNVIVPPADEESADVLGPEPGEYVAVTVKGRADVGPDSSWSPARQTASGLLRKLADRLMVAGARYAYLRRFPPNGSITVFLARAAAGAQKG